MKNLCLIRLLPLLFITVLALPFQARSQIKIGNHPTRIHPFSILEMESGNQALRLTQGDTAAVNAVINADHSREAAEGLLMFYNHSNNGVVGSRDTGIYMRVNGHWEKLLSTHDLEGDFWVLGGNTFDGSTPSAKQQDSIDSYLGTRAKTPFTLGVDNHGLILLHSNGSLQILADSTLFDHPVIIDDSLVIKGLKETMGGDNELLVLGSNGTVHKMKINNLPTPVVGGSSVGAIALKFDTTAMSQGHDAPWIDSSKKATDSMLILNIPIAAAHVTGLISDSFQVIGGAKSFYDSLAVGSEKPPKATLDIAGNVNLKAKTINGDYDMNSSPETASLRTLIIDVSGKNATTTEVTLPVAADVEGRIYTIRKVGDTDQNQLTEPVKLTGLFADGGTSMKLYNNFTSVTIEAHNSKWHIIGH